MWFIGLLMISDWVIIQIAYPDISEADQIPMILQHDAIFLMNSIGWRPDILGSSLNFRLMLYQNSVPENGNVCRFFYASVLSKLRSFIDNVIGIPFTGWHGCICLWNYMLVDACRHSVGVVIFFVIFMYLALIPLF